MKPSPTTVSLLLTNLRLLDYDNGSEGSFPITSDIFTSLKNKSKAFEHIVYHLLRTLDPEECAIRLEPCWPTYEPAQSREFRNIVFRWLTDLKKGGQMGGNILIRRTLLDDCSGDRYEELLLSLSTAVLRSQIEKGNFQDANRKTLAYKQTSSLAPSSKVLAALILAYQSSLTRLLLSRRLSKSQWSSFSYFLDTKESQISGLSDTLSQPIPDETPKIPPRGYEEVLRKWRNNWLGDQRWLDILLEGDPGYRRDQFFELPFEKALAKHYHFKNGLVGIGNGEVSLRALEKQVQEQNGRLRELRKMGEAAFQSVPNLDVTTSPRAESNIEETRGGGNNLRVVFNQHQCLHSNQLKVVSDYMANQRNEYTELLDSLREDLVAAGIPSRRESSTSLKNRFRPSSELLMLNPEPEILGEPMEIDDEEPEPPIPKYPRYDCESGHGTESMSPLREQYNTPSIKVPQQTKEFEPCPTAAIGASYPCGNGDDKGFSAFEESIVIPDPPTSHPDPAPPQPPQDGKPLMRNSLGFIDDELLAEQIVSTMVSTTFSPEKPSPIKRTQQHRQPYQPPLDDTFDMDGSTLDLGTYLPQSTRYQQNEQLPFFSPREVLPTPLKNPLPHRVRKEDLLLSSDYNSVFKSRPKIAVSPPFTPANESPDMLPDLSLVPEMNKATEGVFATEDMADFATEHASSPLTRKNGRGEI